MKVKLLISAIIFLSMRGFSQERVTTVGLQIKPIIPGGLLSSAKQEIEKSNIQFSLHPKAGLSFGMVIRKGLTKRFSLEGGLNILRRNYDITIQDPDSSFVGKSDFRLINYEIPVLGLVYIQLGENLYMNAAGGVSFNIYPTNLFTFDDYFQSTVIRFNWLQTSLLSNIGWEYRTKKSGYIYFGASYHLPFTIIMKDLVIYNGFGRNEAALFELSGKYLTVDIRYFFHEDKQRKQYKLKRQKKPKEK